MALFIHGKKEGVDKLVDGFIESLQTADSSAPVPPKLQIKKRIQDISERRKGGEVRSTPAGNSTESAEPKIAPTTFGTSRWQVHTEVAVNLGLEV